MSCRRYAIGMLESGSHPSSGGSPHKSLDPRVDECPLASPLTRVLRHLGTAGLSDGPTGWWWLPIH